MLVQIPGTTLFRDTESMAIVNKDRNGLQEYYRKRNLLHHRAEEINTMKEELKTLKDDTQEIKNLLLKLMDKN